MHKFQPVLELLRNKSVSDFQNAFGESYRSDTGIDFESFSTLLKCKLCLDVNDRDVNNLFCQIDRYSKGTITSVELNDYLGNYEEKRMQPHEGPFVPKPTIYPGVRCQDSIIDWILYPEIPDVLDEVAEHYISVSRSGIIGVWTKDMKKRFETTIETIDDGVIGKKTTWATSLICLPKEKMLAVSTTSGDIRFFRSSLYKFEHKFSIVCLPYIVLRLNCFDSQILVCGDFSGSVFIIHMEKIFFTRNRRKASHLPPEKILFDHLKLGKISGLSFEETTKLHYSPVQEVEYIPILEAVISCSVNTKRAMLIHFLDNNESLSFTSFGGINCFAFCERLNCVATGGADHSIKIWNPTVNAMYNELLSDHTSPVNHVLVVESRLLLISSDREKIIRVWDLLRPKCLQVIKFKETEFPGRQCFASLFLDPSDGRLILTTYQIGKLEFFELEFREKTHPCSEYIILAAYSSVYNCIVTVGNAASVSVWDCESGSLVYEFVKSHEILDSGGIPRNMLIMAAGLDPSGRRLVTADRIGTIKVWNFHLGLCLQSFQAHCIIMSLAFVGFHIYAAGSSEIVMDFYDNGCEAVGPVKWDKRHKRAIISLDCYRGFLLASATVDGEIIIWLRKSTDAKFHLKDLEEDEQDAKVDVDYLAKSEISNRRRCSISQILFLQKRAMDFFVGNLVSCGMDGRIRFWNIVCTHKVNSGKLLSKFRSVFRDSDGVLCLATDIENRFLISGDTMGYVRVYELDSYYSTYGSAHPKSLDAAGHQFAKFPFLRLQKLVDQRHPENSKFTNDHGSELGFVPFLLNCFQAHLRAVLKVSYDSEKDILITAGRESSVRLWSISGIYIGRLGPTEEPWAFPVQYKKPFYKPPDIKSVASTLTLFVMNNGNIPHWTRALQALRKCRLGHGPEGFKEKPLRWKLKKSLSLEDLSGYGTLEEELAKRLPYFRGTRSCKQNFFQDIDKEM